MIVQKIEVCFGTGSIERSGFSSLKFHVKWLRGEEHTLGKDITQAITYKCTMGERKNLEWFVQQFEQYSGELARNWVWLPLLSDNDRAVNAEQDTIVRRHEHLIKQLDKSVSELLKGDFQGADAHLTALVPYICRYCFEDVSRAPWTTAEGRRCARNITMTLSQNFSEQMQNALIAASLPALEDIKKFKLADKVTATGRSQMSRMTIRDKLIGRSYTQTLDKMDVFKRDHVTSLGYLNALIMCYDVERNWRYIMPLLLTFLDDTDSMVKREACCSLNLLCYRLPRNSENIIKKSQTLPLFTKALHPLLLALPSLTPEEKSGIILPIVYDTTFMLYRLAVIDDLERYSTLSALLNDTLLPSISKCKDYVDLILILMDILNQFINECESYAIVLTKQIVYTLMTVLMDPYISHAEKVVAAMVGIVHRCIDNVPRERRARYKYDVRGCMGTLKRRLSARDDRDLADVLDKIDALLEAVDV